MASRSSAEKILEGSICDKVLVLMEYEPIISPPMAAKMLRVKGDSTRQALNRLEKYGYVVVCEYITRGKQKLKTYKRTKKPIPDSEDEDPPSTKIIHNSPPWRFVLPGSIYGSKRCRK